MKILKFATLYLIPQYSWGRSPNTKFEKGLNITIDWYLDKLIK